MITKPLLRKGLFRLQLLLLHNSGMAGLHHYIYEGQEGKAHISTAGGAVPKTFENQSAFGVLYFFIPFPLTEASFVRVWAQKKPA